MIVLEYLLHTYTSKVSERAKSLFISIEISDIIYVGISTSTRMPKISLLRNGLIN